MFYTGLHAAYAVLLCAALWFNRACLRTLLLSVVVFVALVWPNKYLPGDSVPLWYFKCFLVEMAVIVLAYRLQSPVSWYIVSFSSVLCAAHLVRMYTGPTEGWSPYRIGIPLLETAELLICVLLSHSGRQLLARRAERTLLLRGRNV